MKKLAITLSLAFLGIIAFAQTEVTIFQIQGQQEHSPYLGETVKTQGIVTGVFSESYFIQDGEGAWNGVYVYSTEAVAEGDEVELTCEVAEYFDLTELKNVSEFTLLSTGNILPPATILSTLAITDEAYEGVLVKVENAVCSNDNAGYGEWELDDGSGPCLVDDMGFSYSPVLGLSYTVTGPLNYSYLYYKIEPRYENDIINMETLYFVNEPEQINPEKNSVTLKWETNVEASTELFWGTTPELGDGHMTLTGNTIEHEIHLPDLLSPSSIYYLRAFSVIDTDTTPNFTKPYATVSNSSGEVNLYFNHTVDYTVTSGEMAVWTPNITDTVIHYLNMAQQTLDITMYEQESDVIVAAINEAYENGVQVRYITDDIGNNPALENLNENIPVLYGNTDAIMHDKFIIIDAGSEMGAWLITGSLNHTVNNLGWDYNNMICIQDKSIALGFELEFEEMWGSDGPMYNEANAKFGASKTNNTPHKFLIDDIPMEAYFSPSDNTTSKIKTAINQAENTLEFGIMVFTENSLGNAIVGAQQSGLEISGIIDYTGYSGSEYQYLKDNGVNVREYVNPDGSEWPDGPVFHHKYAIVDFQEGATNPVLITGSHNWSASAESINDENTLIIYDANLANQFHQEFSQRFKDLLTPLAMDDDTITQENTQVIVNILDNDFVPVNVTTTSEIVESPDHGQAEITEGILFYVPNDGYNGKDSLSYKLFNNDMTELSDTAWVRIEVGELGIGEINPVRFSILHQSVDNGILDLEIYSRQAEDIQIKLFCLNGKLLASENTRISSGSNFVKIELSSISKGILLLDLKGESGKVSSKVIY
jgi:hypothetical protein